MAAIYAHWAGTKVFYTSQPYPIVAQDSIEEVLDLPSMYMVQWVPVNWDESQEMLSATLTVVISYSFPDLGLDTWDEDIACIQATLQQLIDYVQFEQGPETWDEDQDVLSATLTHVIGYIFIIQPPDEIEEEFDITGITLVDV